MAESEFEKGYVAHLTIERVIDDARIITFDAVVPSTFRTTEQKATLLAEILKEKTGQKHTDLIINFVVRPAIKNGKDVYVKA